MLGRWHVCCAEVWAGAAGAALACTWVAALAALAARGLGPLWP